MIGKVIGASVAIESQDGLAEAIVTIAVRARQMIPQSPKPKMWITRSPRDPGETVETARRDEIAGIDVEAKSGDPVEIATAVVLALVTDGKAIDPGVVVRYVISLVSAHPFGNRKRLTSGSWLRQRGERWKPRHTLLLSKRPERKACQSQDGPIGRPHPGREMIELLVLCH